LQMQMMGRISGPGPFRPRGFFPSSAAPGRSFSSPCLRLSLPPLMMLSSAWIAPLPSAPPNAPSISSMTTRFGRLSPITALI
jgi:hypothetical protein